MNICVAVGVIGAFAVGIQGQAELQPALVHLQNNILRAMDHGKVGIIVRLDMSAPFLNCWPYDVAGQTSHGA